MDWEIYERYRATLLLVGVALLSFLLLIFQKTSVVRYLRSFLVVTTLPTERFLSGWKGEMTEPSPAVVLPVPLPGPASDSSGPQPETAVSAALIPSEEQRLLGTLLNENRRLQELLELKEHEFPKALAAHIVGRDPQRWFQEIVLDKGKDEGVSVDDPVLALANGHEALVGRVIETTPHVSKVMLIQDSLSAVAVTVRSEKLQDGVVEGGNGHVLLLKYLDRGSAIKLGDMVVTSGLGAAFPEGIPIGWVEDITLDPRQLFLQAHVRPILGATPLHVVLILVKRP